MNFQENLKRLRKEAGYNSSKDFAAALGIPHATYLGYENGGREPKFELLCKMADLLKTSVDEMLGRTVEKKIADVTWRDIGRCLACLILVAPAQRVESAPRKFTYKSGNGFTADNGISIDVDRNPVDQFNNPQNMSAAIKVPLMNFYYYDDGSKYPDYVKTPYEEELGKLFDMIRDLKAAPAILEKPSIVSAAINDVLREIPDTSIRIPIIPITMEIKRNGAKVKKIP